MATSCSVSMCFQLVISNTNICNLFSNDSVRATQRHTVMHCCNSPLRMNNFPGDMACFKIKKENLKIEEI